MKKPVRIGLLLICISLICLSLFLFSSQVVYANEEEVVEEEEESEELSEEEIFDMEKAEAIKAADDAIRRMTNPRFIVGYEQAFVEEVAYAISLVEYAREEYDAEDGDFADLEKLNQAEKQVLKYLAIKAAQDAIDKIPPIEDITEEDRAVIEEARRLVKIAIEEHGATPFQICWRYEYLEDAEDRLPEEEEPEPEPEKPDDREPTPPTGGASGAVAIGLIMAGTGLFTLHRKRKGCH